MQFGREFRPFSLQRGMALRPGINLADEAKRAADVSQLPTFSPPPKSPPSFSQSSSRCTAARELPPVMRSILGIVLLLMGAGLVSCRIERRSADAHSQQTANDWVRTADGWERAHNWKPSLAAPPAIHPLVIASGQLLVSMLALTAAKRPESVSCGQ
jgi:hypothetical protein